MADFQAMAEALIKGQAPTVKELVQAAVDEGISPGEILSNGMIAGMAVVGERFKKNEIYVPEVLIAARAMIDSSKGVSAVADAIEEAIRNARQEEGRPSLMLSKYKK